VQAQIGGWETWEWDESLFTGAASYYEQGRLPYAPGLADAVAEHLVQVDAPAYRDDDLHAETERDRLAHPPPPDTAIDRLRRLYLGPDRRAGRSIRNTSPSGEDAIFRGAGFLPAHIVVVPDQRTIDRSVVDLVARVFSSSGTAPHRFGERIGDFEHDLRALLVEASPWGLFSLRLPDNILRIWRPAVARR
jgi:hypothetical protein